MEEPAITKAQSVFSMSCRVEVNVRAEAQGVWRLLTDAKGFPQLELHRLPHRGPDQ